MIISVEPEKAFEQSQHSFTVKTFSKLRIKENTFNLIKGID